MEKTILAQSFFETDRPGSEETGNRIIEGLNSIGNSNWGQNFMNSGSQDFKGVINVVISSIFNPLIILFLGLAIVYFLWGVLKYVRHGESESDRTEGIMMMTYGIVAIFVMISVWGLVTILINTFGLDTRLPPVPTLQ